MKRVVAINTACNCTSTGRVAEQIGCHAMAEGWDAYIVHSSRYAAPTKMNSHAVQSKGADAWHFTFQSLLLGRAGLGSVAATKKLITYLDELNPDVVHLHNLHGHYINYPLLLRYLAKRNAPVAWTLHDFWPITGHCAYFDSIACTKWRTGCHHCALKHDYPTSLLVDTSQSAFALKKSLIGAMHNLVFVAVSHWQARIIKESSIVAGHEVQMIHNGIDTTTFHPSPTARGDGKIIILGAAASGFSKRKGLNDFNRLRELLPEDKYDIRLIGVKRKDKSSLHPGITALPYTSNAEEMARFYNSGTVFANPTYSDTSSMTSLEAQGCGLPVVAYASGGVPETIHPQSGIVVERGNVYALAKAITQIGGSYSAEISQWIKTQFDSRDMGRRYLNLYNTII